MSTTKITVSGTFQTRENIKTGGAHMAFAGTTVWRGMTVEVSYNDSGLFVWLDGFRVPATTNNKLSGPGFGPDGYARTKRETGKITIEVADDITSAHVASWKRQAAARAAFVPQVAALVERMTTAPAYMQEEITALKGIMDRLAGETS